MLPDGEGFPGGTGREIWFVARPVRASTRFASYGAFLALIRVAGVSSRLKKQSMDADARGCAAWSAPADPPFLVPGATRPFELAGRDSVPIPADAQPEHRLGGRSLQMTYRKVSGEAWKGWPISGQFPVPGGEPRCREMAPGRVRQAGFPGSAGRPRSPRCDVRAHGRRASGAGNIPR